MVILIFPVPSGTRATFLRTYNSKALFHFRQCCEKDWGSPFTRKAANHRRLSHWCRNSTHLLTALAEPSLSCDPSGIAPHNLFKQMQISLKTLTKVSSVIPFSCRILMLNRYDATGFQQKPNTINTLLKASQGQQQSRQGIVGCVICISTSGKRKQP